MKIPRKAARLLERLTEDFNQDARALQAEGMPTAREKTIAEVLTMCILEFAAAYYPEELERIESNAEFERQITDLAQVAASTAALEVARIVTESKEPLTHEEIRRRLTEGSGKK